MNMTEPTDCLLVAVNLFRKQQLDDLIQADPSYYDEIDTGTVRPLVEV